MHARSLLALLAVLLPVHRYVTGDIATSAVSSDSTALLRVLDSADAAFSSAMMRGDADAVGAFYTDDAVVFVQGRDAVIGRPAITQAFAGFLRGITIRDMRLELADLIIAGDIVVERGAYRMVVHSQSGAGADIADHGKFLTVWRRVGRGTWKIVRDCSQSDRGM